MQWFRALAVFALLIGSASGQVIEVESYGADVDDGIDDTSAIAQAFAAVGTGPARIVFEQGTYDLFVTAIPQEFALANKSSVIIAGNGATLKLHAFDPNEQWGGYPKGALFNFTNIDGLLVKDLTVVMDREPYSLAVIKAKGATGGLNWIDIQIDSAYSDVTSNLVIERIDDITSGGAPKSTSFTVQLASDHYSTEPSTNGWIRIEEDDPQKNPWFHECLQNAALDEHLLLMHSKYGTHFLMARSCSNVTVSNVVLQDMPGMGVVAYNCHDVKVDGLDLLPDPVRCLSITADGVHLQDCTGDIEMLNCEMRQMGDDGLNVHGKYVRVTDVQGGTLTLEHRGYWEMDWQPGDVVQFLTEELDVYATATVSAFNSSNLTVTFTSTPSVAVGDFLTNLSNAPDSVTVDNCIVEDNLARGVVIRADNTVVQNCSFKGNVSAGVLIQAEVSDYWEAHGVDGVTVQNCTFDDVNRYTWSTLGALTITASFEGLSKPLSPHAVHSNIAVKWNTFKNLHDDSGNRDKRAAVWITSADDVEVKWNGFRGIDPDLYLVKVKHATGVTIAGNCANGFTGVPVHQKYSQVIPQSTWPTCQ